MAETNANVTPMEQPGWVQQFIDQFSGLMGEFPQHAWGSYEDIRGTGDDYSEWLLNRAQWVPQVADEAYGKAGDQYSDIYNRLMWGDAAIPELGAGSQYMTDYQGYIDKAAESLLNPVEIGYGGDMTSFVPGKSAQAYADIMQEYPSMVGQMLAARDKDLERLPGLIDAQAMAGMAPELLKSQLGDKYYQQRMNLVENYPEGWPYEQQLNYLKNLWYPMELTRHFAAPSYDISTDPGVLGNIGQGLGILDLGTSVLGGLFGEGGLLGGLFGGSGGGAPGSAAGMLADSVGSWLMG